MGEWTVAVKRCQYADWMHPSAKSWRTRSSASTVSGRVSVGKQVVLALPSRQAEYGERSEGPGGNKLEVRPARHPGATAEERGGCGEGECGPGHKSPHVEENETSEGLALALTSSACKHTVNDLREDRP